MGREGGRRSADPLVWALLARRAHSRRALLYCRPRQRPDAHATGWRRPGDAVLIGGHCASAALLHARRLRAAAGPTRVPGGRHPQPWEDGGTAIKGSIAAWRACFTGREVRTAPVVMLAPPSPPLAGIEALCLYNCSKEVKAAARAPARGVPLLPARDACAQRPAEAGRVSTRPPSRGHGARGTV